MRKINLKWIVIGIDILLVLFVIGLITKRGFSETGITVIYQEQIAKKYFNRSNLEEDIYTDGKGKDILLLRYGFPMNDDSWPDEIVNYMAFKRKEMEMNTAEYIRWHEHSYPFEYTYEVISTIEDSKEYVSFFTYQRSLVGGAHANNQYSGAVFDRKSGQILGLEDIIDISDIMMQDIVESLNKQGLLVKVPNIKNEIDEIEFIVEEQGITLIFNPYDIASFGEGPIFVHLNSDYYVR